MMYRNLVYMNINYYCNNNCINCISHNTQRNKYADVPLKEIESVNGILPFSQKDVFVINGGEPTLCPDLFQIIEFTARKCHHSILYTNVSRLKLMRPFAPLNRVTLAVTVNRYQFVSL